MFLKFPKLRQRATYICLCGDMIQFNLATMFNGCFNHHIYIYCVYKSLTNYILITIFATKYKSLSPTLWTRSSSPAWIVRDAEAPLGYSHPSKLAPKMKHSEYQTWFQIRGSLLPKIWSWTTSDNFSLNEAFLKPCVSCTPCTWVWGMFHHVTLSPNRLA